MLMELVLSYLRERKGHTTLKNMPDFDSDSSTLSINGKDPEYNEDEKDRLMKDIDDIQNDKTLVTKDEVKRTVTNKNRVLTRNIIDIHDSDEEEEEEMQQQRIRQQS